MTKYIVQGGKPLFGEVEISGAKNAAVAIIPAALLVDGVCRIENIPQISDVTLCLKILEDLGAGIRSINRHTVEIDCSRIHSTRTNYDMSRKIRASYYLIGSLLGRFGEAEVAMPGGCNFGGVRPIDQHVKGFAALGAKVSVEGGFIHASVGDRRLKGANIYLAVVSVGATMNIMMAAALAEGTTVIENVAKEPHIVDLANFLNSMGADIRGAGTDSIKIDSMETFNKYFAVDGKTHTELASNFDRSKVYALTADLDFSGVAFNSIGKNLKGEENHALFNGQFYGLGHTIKNVNINSEGSSWTDAFFCQIGGEGIKAVVKDINFVDCNITKAGGNFSGILSAFVGDSAMIRNVNAFNCNVVAGDNTHFNNGGTALGGLIGKTWSKDIKYCTFNGYNINMIGQTN